VRRRLLLLAASLPFILVTASFAWSFTGRHAITRQGPRRHVVTIQRGTIQFATVVREKIVGVTPSGFATEEFGFDEPRRFTSKPLPYVLVTNQWPPVSDASAEITTMLAATPVVERCTVKSIAHWPLLVVTSLPIGYWLLIERRRHLADCRRAAGFCPRCGYDMRASPDRCPECGLTHSP
jgi:hypothetical protein